MAQMRLLGSVLALALLGSVTSMPMVPFSHGLMGLLGHGMFGTGSQIGSSYRGGASYRGNSAGSQNLGMVTQAPRLLVGKEQVLSVQNKLIEGLHVVIEASEPPSSPVMPTAGAFSMATLFGTSFLSYMGPFGGLLEGPGPGVHQSDQLKATIRVKILDGTPTQEYLLVFTEASDPGLPGTPTHCAPDAQGAVITSPSMEQGYGGSMDMMSAGRYLHDHMGQMHSASGQNEFGVIATLTLSEGLNAFEIQGLGPFTRLDQLAGHGVNLCKDVTMGLDGRPTCTNLGYDSNLFCAKLSYALDPGMLEVPDFEDPFNPFDPGFDDHPLL